jgi:transketolase C-terminal domain/subunit
VKDANQPVGEGVQGFIAGLASGDELVIVATGTRRAARAEVAHRKVASARVRLGVIRRFTVFNLPERLVMGALPK